MDAAVPTYGTDEVMLPRSSKRSPDEGWSAIKSGHSEVFWTITAGEYFEGKKMQPSFQSGWYWSNCFGRIAIP